MTDADPNRLRETIGPAVAAPGIAQLAGRIAAGRDDAARAEVDNPVAVDRDFVSATVDRVAGRDLDLPRLRSIAVDRRDTADLRAADDAEAVQHPVVAAETLGEVLRLEVQLRRGDQLPREVARTLEGAEAAGGHVGRDCAGDHRSAPSSW